MRAAAGLLAVLAGAAIAGGGLSGCEAALAPIEPGERYFSLSGFLDASRDTNWVRVEPVTPDLVPRPAVLDAAVHLVRVATGAATPMRQRVRTFATGPAHLFWTVEPIRRGETYRIVVRSPAGEETRATVRVPDASVVPELVSSPLQCPTLVYVPAGARVIDVQAHYTHPEAVEPTRFSKLRSLKAEPDGGLRASVYFGDDAREMALDPLGVFDPRLTARLTVAVGTGDWPETLGLDLETALILRTNPDIENGVGFVGGVASWTGRFQPGFGNNPPVNQPFIPCFAPR